MFSRWSVIHHVSCVMYHVSSHLCKHGAEDGGQIVGVRRGNGVTTQRHLNQGQAEAPEVRGHAVLRALQPLG